VMTLASSVIAMRRVARGESVGYGGAWVATADSLIAIIAALFARTADGLGRTVSSSLLEFALSCFTSYAADILETGASPGLLGNDSPQFAPYGVFRCQDGSLALAGAGILVAPGEFYGARGAQHVRVALTATDERIAAAVDRLGE